jgi:N-acetylglucosamine-6-sulfatase
MPRVNRRDFLMTAAAAGAALPFAACSRRRPPNVVFMLSDDLRWDAMSCAGHPFLKTPRIDQLANEGVRFSNAFCTSSLCSPSRASFLSGLYAHTHQVINNFTEFPTSVPSYPQRLHDAGYNTAYIGKWHMGEGNDEKRPGFDYWASHKGQGQYYDTPFNVNGRREVIKGYYAHVVTNLAKDFLRTAKPPFSLSIGHKAPHGLWIPEAKYEHAFDNVEIKKPVTAEPGPGTPDWVSRRIKTWHGIDGPLYGANDFGKFVRTYHETILSVDDSVGEIYDTLRAMGELDNTIFVFAGDNGFLLGEHASIDKRTMWEESIRIPLLVRYPEAIRTPKVEDRMVLNIDLAPSLIDFCGATALPNVQGQSFRPLAEGRSTPWRSSWLYEYNFEDEFPYTPNVRGVRTDEWAYMHYPNGEGQPDTEMAELYNVKKDPLETTNLINAPEAQEQLASLKTELTRLQQESGAIPDKMPINPQLRFEMPDAAIR